MLCSQQCGCSVTKQKGMYFNTMIDNGLLNCRESVRPPLLNHRPMKRRSSTRRRWAMVLPVRYVRLQLECFAAVRLKDQLYNHLGGSNCNIAFLAN